MRPTLLAAIVLAGASVAAATDRPIAGDLLALRDPPNDAHRSVRFRDAGDPAINPTLGADPRTVGATLEIAGTGAGDGASGTISLDAAHWVGLGRPAGSAGFKYLDKSVSTGIRVVIFKTGRKGGRLSIAGGGVGWPYAIAQAQGPIDVRFVVGGDRWCAHFGSFATDQPGRVTGKNAPAPADCGAAPATCGNGTIEGAEECDDGNTASGDGCSAACTLESAAGLCAGVPTVAGTALDSVRIASGLDMPVHLTAPPLDPRRVFVTEQTGRVRVIVDDVLQAAPFLDIHDKITCCGERGLLSVAFHPAYKTNGFFYVNYTNTDGNTVIARYHVTADPNVADPTSEHILLTITQPFANHNGGLNLFGPDGALYVGMGDGGSAGDPLENGQSDATFLGKLLRIDVATESGSIFAKGLRNPWRFSFDRATGDLYLGDVGQGNWEEVDFQPAPLAAGVNYGWDVFEGRHCYDPQPLFATCPNPPTGFTMPVLEYDHSTGACSITGGFVYRGCRMRDLRGTYFYSDYCQPFIKTFRGVAGGDAQNLADRTADVAPGGGLAIDSVTSFGEDARGELYIVDYGTGGATGEVYRIVPGS